ncbi:MAG: hypothetical protein HN348_08525 [Proteobacteria bacterium]|nr:hypothetical protein [Pseudomonadota bacterium]
MRFPLLFLFGCQITPVYQADEAEYESLPALNDDDTEAILWLANSASLDTLDEQVGLDVRAAENILRYRHGDDGKAGTFDDVEFHSAKEIDGIKYVGPAGLELMLRYVQTHDVLVRIPSHIWGDELTMLTRCVGTTWDGDLSYQSFDFDIFSVTAIVEDDEAVSLLSIDEPKWDIQAQLPISIALEEDGYGETGRHHYEGLGTDETYFYDIVIDANRRGIVVEVQFGIEELATGTAWGMDCVFGTPWDLVDVHVFGIAEGSREALAILDVVNTATLEELDDEVRLDSRAADNIVAAREEAAIASLTDLDAIGYVGESAFAKLVDHISANAL